MKTKITKNLILRSSMALAVMLTVHTPSSSWSADPAEGKGMMMDSKKMEKCESMMKEKQKMQAEMKVQDAELTAAVATMNSSAQDQKLDLLAGIVTQLVEQRTAMHVQKAKMEEKMMECMMMGNESMSNSPKMKKMERMGDSSTLDQSEDQQE